MSWNCLILYKIHFLNVNIVIESLSVEKQQFEKICSPNIFLHGQNNKYDFKKLDISLTQSLEWKLIIFVAFIKFI